MKNAKLQNCIKLASKVTVYVPGTNGIDKAADNTVAVDATATLLSDLFGGATSTPARGYWVSPSAGLVKENTTVVFAYASEAALDSGIDSVVDHCAKMCKELAQDAIALEVNGEMYFIEAN